MITREMLTDAFRAFAEDVTDGRWPPDDLAHSAIVELFDHLPTADPKSEPDGDAHPDLIDRDGDRWHWRAGYVLNDNDFLDSRNAVNREYGPVRDA